jgi:single-strand DNA-binding protein
MANYNKVLLIGRLTKDPELKATSGQNVCNLGLAINRTWMTNGEKKEETTFVDVTAWGKTAENAHKYLARGSQCLIEGRLTLNRWTGPDGTAHSRLTVTAELVLFLDPPRGQQAATPAPAPTEKTAPASEIDEDTIPF